MPNLRRSLGSVGALAAFAIGVPACNVVTGGTPDQLVPRTVPDLSVPGALHRVGEDLRWAYLDGTLIPWLAHTVVWCGWAIGIILILLDVVRLLRVGGIVAARHLAGRSPHSWITGLVASALLMFSASNAAATPAGTTIVATADHQPEPKAPRPDPYHVPDELRPDCPRHQVVLGDTYWSLAEHHLGDGRRYPEIDALNHDRIPNPHHLLPGMVVLLAPDATNLPQPIPGGAPQVVVEAGETASSIALREYGDPNAWHRLWDLNRNRPQPDGRAWRTPDLLLPGWRLQTAEPPPAPPPPAVPPPPQPVAPPSTPTTAVTPPPTTTAAPSTAAVAGPTPGTAVSLPTDAFVSIGLAALVTAAVFSLRLRHRRHRPTTAGSHDPTLAPVVRALRVEYDRATLPRADDGGLDYTDNTAVPYEVAGREHAVHVAEGLLPAGKIALGAREGQLAALDLAAAGGLGLNGPGATAAARALLVTLHAQQQAQIVIPAADVPLLFDTADLRDTPAVQIASDAPAALDMAAEFASTDRPVVLVMAAPEGRAQLQLEKVIGDHPHTIVAILLGPWPAGVTLTVAADGAARGAQWSGTRLFHLPATDAADLLTLFRHVHSTEQPDVDKPELAAVSESAWPPTAGDEIDRARPLHLQVLGRLHLRWTGAANQDLIEALAPRQREILTYLALHPAGCRREGLTAALWPDAPLDRPHNAFHATLSQLRGALRKTTAGAISEITVNTDGHYGLNPALISVDLWQLQDALRNVRVALTPDDLLAGLERVLDLYTGRLADGFAAGWIEPYREAIHRDALGAISQLISHVGQRDPAQAVLLLERARDLDPYNEAIYRDLMRLHARLGHRDAIRRTLVLLTTALAEIDARPAGGTIQLAQALAAQRGA
ncbi:BTAD domain-containing putative transcriptional regulator [Kutzneria buriramensis]|uniref:DNA-binding SARP family transcriptional activator n=1 Tax=Kutzneria buriramensis TaxID=1045776 RepID=A0A3E0GV63_9PSEU|nr:BTAD domain-containing putative transcriptional regulator [Kutzneria buriramensis]REH28644.1 DNA-binding SARP family transcriptional activator [Kutzneria buriramensis]